MAQGGICFARDRGWNKVALRGNQAEPAASSQFRAAPGPKHSLPALFWLQTGDAGDTLEEKAQL
jgi:hypothetical protein